MLNKKQIFVDFFVPCRLMDQAIAWLNIKRIRPVKALRGVLTPLKLNCNVTGRMAKILIQNSEVFYGSYC